MGLDTTHDAWHGPYSSFMRWRTFIAKKAGLGNLRDYEGYGGQLPFSSIEQDGLRTLLSHSDCDGELTPDECKSISDDLMNLLPLMNGADPNEQYFKEKTETFINGCMAAYHLKETLYFQ